MNIKNNFNNLKNIFENKKEKIFFCLIFILFSNMGLLIISQGITLNDEIIMYERRMDGWFNLLIKGIKGEILQGRPLRSMAAFNVAITNITENIYFNRFIQIVIFAILLYLVYKLIFKLFDKRTSNIWLFMSLSCLPILFEHGVPTAYNGLTLIPFLELILSIHFWVQYLENNRKKYYVFSIIFWIISLCGYEFLVTYTPIFIFIYLFKKFKKNNPIILECTKKCVFHCIIGIIYVMLTFILQKTINVTYDGVTMNFTNFKGIANAILVLVTSSLPGAYLFNNKYKYLINLYKNNIDNMQNLMFIPLILSLIYFIILLIIKKRNRYEKIKEKNNLIRTSLIFICLISYLIIPLLPNAITTMYQELVSFDSFSWFPVSIFIFFTACLIFAYLTTIIMNKKYKIGIILIIMYISFIAIPVQYMNIVIGNKNIDNYKRVRNIESVLKTKTIKRLNDINLISEDVFETNDLLAIHDSFWNSISNANNLNVKFIKYKNKMEPNDKKVEAWFSYVDDEYFCITTEGEAAILSKKNLKGVKILEIFKDKYDIVKIENGFYDNGYYVYRYIMKDDKWISSNNSADTFKRFSTKAGSNKKNIISIYGIEDDYWVNKQSEFIIKSLEKGIITLDVYLPNYNEENNNNLNISINNKKFKKYPLTSELTTIELKVSPSVENNIRINSDFLTTSKNNDPRELSWILSDVNGY